MTQRPVAPMAENAAHATVRGLKPMVALTCWVFVVDVPLALTSGLWRVAQGTRMPLLLKGFSISLRRESIPLEAAEGFVATLNDFSMSLPILLIVLRRALATAEFALSSLATRVLAYIKIVKRQNLLASGALFGHSRPS